MIPPLLSELSKLEAGMGEKQRKERAPQGTGGGSGWSRCLKQPASPLGIASGAVHLRAQTASPGGFHFDP